MKINVKKLTDEQLESRLQLNRGLIDDNNDWMQVLRQRNALNLERCLEVRREQTRRAKEAKS